MSNHELAHGEGAHAHWDTSIYPLIISLGILALTVAFMFQFVYHLPFAAIIALGLSLPLILGGVAGWTGEAMGTGEGFSFASMGWFILAEAMIFISCFAAYWFGRLEAPVWPLPGSVELPKLLPVIMTIALVTSSVTIHRVEHYVHAGEKAGVVKWLLITVVLGLAFLGMSAYEWSHLIHQGFTIKTNLFGTVFYSITGMHGSHVLVGLSIFLAGLIPAMKGNLSPGYWRTAGLYWHFVDIIWFFVVSQVYFW
ncbi:MAG: heme-copper oxidase subunit III [Sulfuritalea sp.]|jgi:cytochrome c oxidase subunit 3|nr:heme-copper oxidase subunit III [Sulfuritalea sp.]MDP1982470.1 heme-copper oxidase subunit III [Sulfuritalea sp.]